MQDLTRHSYPGNRTGAPPRVGIDADKGKGDMQFGNFASYIEQHPGVTQDELARHLGVSTRTVRKYVRQFNSAMTDCASVKLTPNRGYRFHVTDVSGWCQRVMRMDGLVEQSFPSTPEQRVFYIMNDLLSRTGWVKLDDFAQTLYVSRRTISYDMKRVEERLRAFGLTLEEKPYQGIRVLGPEAAKRSCWTHEMAAMMGDAERPDAIKVDDLMRTVSDIVADELSRCERPFDSLSQQSLILHTAIAVIRIKADSRGPLDPVDLELGESCGSLDLARALAARVERELGVTLPEDEIAYIALHLDAGELSFASDATAGEDGTSIAPEVWELAELMVSTVYYAFAFDFRDDLELRLNLARHIEPLLSRLDRHAQMENPLLDDLKCSCPLAYAMAAEASVHLVRRCGVEPFDDEVGYIALAFALAIERAKDGERQKKNVLLVCSSGRGFARLLEYRLTSEFPDLIGNIEICSGGLSKRDLSGIDCVFTTVLITMPLPVTVVHINPIPTDDDLTRAHRVLKMPASRGALRFFRPRLFAPHLAVSTKEEVIAKLCHLMSDVYGYELPDDFADSVARREDAFSTALGNRVAMPHPAEACCTSTLACVGLLDRPVVWDARGNEVQLVVLVGFSADGTEDVSALMRVLADLFTDAEQVDHILADQTWSTFTAHLEDAEERERGGDTHGVDWRL